MNLNIIAACFAMLISLVLIFVSWRQISVFSKRETNSIQKSHLLLLIYTALLPGIFLFLGSLAAITYHSFK